MAEVVGIVASGINIVQLTGQVAQSIVRLKDYWSQLKDAPGEISSLLRDLEFLNLLLSDFEQEHIQSRLPDIVFDNEIFRQSLTICKEGAQELSELVDLLNHRSSTTIKFGKQRCAFNVVRNRDQIKRYKSRLKRAISLLSLSHQSYTRQASQRCSFDLGSVANTYCAELLYECNLSHCRQHCPEALFSAKMSLTFLSPFVPKIRSAL